MRVLELFSGTATLARIARERGHQTLTVDSDPRCEPDIVAPVGHSHPLLDRLLEFEPHCVWASPPCETWSVASIGTHWTGGRRAYVPKTEAASAALVLVAMLAGLIEELDPVVWYVENPVGVMRKCSPYEHIPGFFIRQTVTYCQYNDEPGESGLPRMKPTDVWTNNHLWVPRPRCSNGDPCHEAAPRGSKTGTQGRNTYLHRSKLPEELCHETIEAAEMRLAEVPQD